MGTHPHDPSHEADAGRATALDSLRHDERKAAVSRVASTLSHALGTPLNVIAGRAAMIGMDGMSIEEIRNNARIIEQQVRSVASLLRQVLGFAREGRPGLEACDARALAVQALELFEPVARARGVGLVLAEGPKLAAKVQCDAVLQTLTNLISLGVQREPAGGEVAIALAAQQVEPPAMERGRVPAGMYLCFSVSYRSTELPQALLEHVYEPWLSAESADRDAALVLALSYGVARENRGWVDAKFAQGASSFVINWPMPSAT